MANNPTVSIVTPVFNQSSYIEQTIQSVLNQTYQDWEWIIVDDGSTDGTGQIIKKVKDSRIQYIFQEHRGVDHLTASRNKALSLCRGDLIAMLDGDDYWPDYKLEEQVKNFASPDIVLSYGECMIVNGNGRNMSYRPLPADRHIANNCPVGFALRLLLLKRECFITNSTVMVNKEALLRIGGFLDAKDLACDYTTWTRLSLEGRFMAHPVCLAYWRRHPSSTNYRREPARVTRAGIDFLREFVVLNKQKLSALEFSYDMDMLEKYWRRLNPFERYYSRAILALSFGAFREAREDFKAFLRKDRSLKNRLIYLLIILSSYVRYDLVNPLSLLKTKMQKSMRDR